ncbi:MAG: hypothetical protein IPL60_15720 [Ardenticatenia bacterium]|nr:hypothetical protein [Ardenticatenia bacterium]
MRRRPPNWEPNEPPADAIPYPIWSALPADPPCPRCAAPLPPPEARDASDAAFHGKVAAVEDLGPERGHDRLVVYRNLGWWKGRGAFVTVRLPYSLWFCDRGLWMASGTAGDLAPVGRASGLRPAWLRRHLGAEHLWPDPRLPRIRRRRARPGADPPTPAPSATPTAGGEATATTAATGTVDPVSTPTPTAGTSSTATPMAWPHLECPGCPGPRPVREWLAEADAVFLGRVTAFRPVGCDHLVSFRVQERFKGAPAATVDVFVGILSWQCMRRYNAGMEDVVFARADADGRLTIPMCFGITVGDVLGELVVAARRCRREGSAATAARPLIPGNWVDTVGKRYGLVWRFGTDQIAPFQPPGGKAALALPSGCPFYEGQSSPSAGRLDVPRYPLCCPVMVLVHQGSGCGRSTLPGMGQPASGCVHAVLAPGRGPTAPW